MSLKAENYKVYFATTNGLFKLDVTAEVATSYEIAGISSIAASKDKVVIASVNENQIGLTILDTVTTSNTIHLTISRALA